MSRFLYQQDQFTMSHTCYDVHYSSWKPHILVTVAYRLLLHGYYKPRLHVS